MTTDLSGARPAAGAIRAVLFDFDHTLADLGDHVPWADAGVEVQAAYRAAGVPEAVIAEVGGTHSLYAYIARSDLLPADRLAAAQREASAIIERYERAAIDVTQLLAGARTCLRALATLEMPAGIVTSNAGSVVDEILRQEGAGDAFATVVAREDVRLPKPAPEGILAACAALDLAPSMVAYAGDNVHDMQAARDAGVGAIFGVRGGNSDEAALVAAGAHAILDHVGELLPAIGLATGAAK